MSKLKSLLLAGAVIPALAMPPFQPSFAQAPDQERPGAHQRGEGGGGAGMRREPGEGGQHGMRGEGGPGMRGGAGSGAGGREPGEGGPRGGMRGEGGPGTRGGAGREPGAGAPATERRAPAAAAPAPTERAAPAAPADTGADRRAQRRQERDDRAGRPGTNAAPAGADETRSQRGQRGQDREDKGPRNGMRNDNERAPAGAPAATPTPRMGNNPDRTPGERAPDRGQRMGTNPERGPGGNGGPGDRGPGDRGPGVGDRGPGGLDRDRRLGDNPAGRDDRRRGGMSPAGAAAIGVAAGFAGGFMAGNGARRIDDIRRDRREVREGDRTYIREPGRTIVQDGDRRFLVHDPNDRFRELGYRSNRERRGNDFVDTVVLAGGVSVLTFTTPDGRLLRRVRRGPDGRDVVLFENDVRPVEDDVVVLPPPQMRIPRDRYVVDYADADEGSIYDTLVAPPVAPPPQRYSLDQVLYSPTVRNYVRSVDINTINFDTGAWVVPGDQTRKLVSLAQAINKAVDRNPNSVFLIEGYTDAVGNPTDNLSLSDRRAQSVASILTKDFNVPPENLTTQGYGDQNPKEQTSGPSAANRRVVVRNITQLLAAGGAPPQ